MINLEKQQAIDYLERARSTIHPEDRFANLPLLSKMLEIEGIFLQRLINRGTPELAVITLDSTGFPELDSWKVDLAKVMGEYEQIKAKRAKSLLPLLQQLGNASPDNVLKAGQEIMTLLKDDRPLVQSLGTVRTEKDVLYRDALRSVGNGSLPFHLRSSFPGLLFTNFEKDIIINDKPFFDSQTHHQPGFISLSSGDGEFGFKYLDSHTLTFLALIHQDETAYVRILKPNSSLISRSRIGSPRLEDDRRMVSTLHLNNPTQLFTYETQLKVTNEKILESLLTANLTGLPQDRVDEYLSALIEINKLIGKIGIFSDNALSGNDISPEEGEKNIQGFAKAIDKIFASINDDYLRRQVQLAIAKALQPVSEQAKSVSNLPVKKDSKNSAEINRRELQKQALVKLEKYKAQLMGVYDINRTIPGSSQDITIQAGVNLNYINELASGAVADYLRATDRVITIINPWFWQEFTSKLVVTSNGQLSIVGKDRADFTIYIPITHETIQSWSNDYSRLTRELKYLSRLSHSQILKMFEKAIK